VRGCGYRRVIGAAAAACACALLALPLATTATAESVLPASGAQFTVFDHRTPGDGWHVQMTVAKDRHFLGQLVLYSERCTETVITKHVYIRDDASIASSKPFATSDGKHGTWRLDARWTDADQVAGSFQITKRGCDGGVRQFTAERERPGAPKHVHTGFGTPPGSYPSFRAGTAHARAQARQLWKASKREAKRRFATYRRVLALGYKHLPIPWKRPLLFHVRSGRYKYDGRTFDATRPESLVYWWPAGRGPILIGFMYRAPLAGGWPKFAKPLLGWHSHRAGDNVMTHVWLTNDLRSAIANCLPTKQLEAANPRLRFRPTSHLGVLEVHPCPEPQH
jgi:hypothetical protein